ncbi:MAG: hydrogenase expression/formation protein HypE, partial [Planctomycetes bacterium]|nr:hydrogenase expression/formation protein HypE [Planctomycetota bacterium]
GKGDGIYINTAGIGWIADDVDLGAARIRPGDAIIVSGPIGEHGIAVLSVREGLAFRTPVESDTMSLAEAAQALLEEPGAVRMMRDPTRGGLSATLNEIARAARIGIRIDEDSVPVSEGVRAACEILGLDPFAIANEGRLVAIVDPERAEALLERLRRVAGCEGGAAIGRVVEDARSLVTVSTPYGGERVLDLSSGEPLPRIC